MHLHAIASFNYFSQLSVSLLNVDGSKVLKFINSSLAVILQPQYHI